MRNCQTSVDAPDGGFIACGKPALFVVQIGDKRCWYCLEHAASARRFVEQIGQKYVTDIQSRTLINKEAKGA